MADTVLLGECHNRLFSDLSPDERYIAESLIRATPHYRYDLSRLPKMDPPPVPGPASAAAAAKAMIAWVKSRRVD